MGSERDRAIAEAGFRRGYEACTESFAGDGECNECGCGQDRFDEWDPAYRSKPEQVAVIDAIIAAVDAQHPAPAPPREVAMRVAEEVAKAMFYNEIGVRDTDALAAIVSRHLPTDEEREAADAVVEAALRMDPTGDVPEAYIAIGDACDRLLAIRAKRGAR